MKSRLATISGSVSGSMFPLGEADLTIGRLADNIVRIKHSFVSRHHSVIQYRDAHHMIVDLESRHGTKVNGVAITQYVLKQGDLIEIGDARLMYVAGNQAQEGGDPADSVADFLGEPTASIALSDAFYLAPGRVAEALPDRDSIGKALNALLHISRVLSAERDLDLLARRILEQLLEVLPADRTALLLNEDKESDSVGYYARKNGNQKPFSVSMTLRERVSEQRVGLLCNQVIDTDSLSGSDSLAAQTIEALVLVPLMGPDQRIGVLYADTAKAPGLVEEHLELMSAIAGVATAPLENALRLRDLERENRYLRERELNHDMLGTSPPMEKIYTMIGRVAPTSSTVLVRGESGTGKELAARAIHVNSARKERPFVAINCAVLSENLLESELFGHERGAFTGAQTRKIGKLEVTKGGTLFLDEVGELPPVIQAKLLRVLQEREFERLGGTQTIKTDIRLVAATNRDLEACIRAGTFREDLFYRLNVISFHMPALRERRGDISILSDHFAAVHSQHLNRPVLGITAWARSCLEAYDWPGNVRELSNVIERAVVLGEDQRIRLEDLPEALQERLGPTVEGEALTFRGEIDKLKCRLITNALAQANGNITEAAQLLDLHANSLHRLIRNLGLRD